MTNWLRGTVAKPLPAGHSETTGWKPVGVDSRKAVNVILKGRELFDFLWILRTS
jgi:hypothetical protein